MAPQVAPATTASRSLTNSRPSANTSVWKISGAFAFASILIGALIGVLLGYVVGEGRAFRYRVQAQSAIFQLEIERRVTSAVADAVAQAAVPAPAVTTPPPTPHAAEPAAPPVTAEGEAEPEPEPDVDETPAPPPTFPFPPARSAVQCKGIFPVGLLPFPNVVRAVRFPGRRVPRRMGPVAMSPESERTREELLDDLRQAQARDCAA